MTKKIQKSLLLAALITVFTSSAKAEDKKNYTELGFGRIAYEADGWRLLPFIGKLSVGTKLMDGIAVEGMVATGLASSSIGGVTLKVNNAVAAYVRPYVKLNNDFELFARLGYFQGTLTASGPGGVISETGSDFSYGIGAAMAISENSALTVDYTSFFNNNGTNVYGYTIGARFGF